MHRRPEPPPEDLIAVRDALWRLSGEISALERDLDRFDLTPTQARILMELGAGQALTASALAERIAVERSTLSRSAKPLIDSGLVAAGVDHNDRRRQPLSLTARGCKRLGAVGGALSAPLSAAFASAGAGTESANLARELDGLARALRHNRLGAAFQIRPIRRRDNRALAELIRAVLTEFDAARQDTAFADAELDHMCQAYDRRGAGYWIVHHGGRVVGGGGFAPLDGGPDDTCELRKMYFSRETRGRGIGWRLLSKILDAARTGGYRRCYAETLTWMHAACRLYEQNGFTRQKSRLGDTGHVGCNTYYLLELT